VKGGQQAARRTFVERSAAAVEEQVASGKLFLAAVPQASWHPTEVRVERPQPRIIA
jgi:hypothetical protein